MRKIVLHPHRRPPAAQLALFDPKPQLKLIAHPVASGRQLAGIAAKCQGWVVWSALDAASDLTCAATLAELEVALDATADELAPSPAAISRLADVVNALAREGVALCFALRRVRPAQPVRGAGGKSTATAGEKRLSSNERNLTIGIVYLAAVRADRQPDLIVVPLSPDA